MKKSTSPATARSLAVASRTTWLSVRTFSSGSSLFNSATALRTSVVIVDAGCLVRTFR
jgi:hypothetical protein